MNTNFAVQTALTLTNGALGGTGTLTIGVATATVTTTRTLGSLTNTPNFITYTSAAPYNILYNGATSINTGNELPTSTASTFGTLTVNVAGTNVTLTANANIGQLITSIATTTTFNLNGFTLGLSSATSISNTGVLTANASGSAIDLNGTVAQTFTLGGTYTGSVINNLVSDNTFTTTGATIGTANINVKSLTVNSGKYPFIR